MKPLPKHLRPRWRYLAVGVETWPDAELDRETVQEALWATARRLLGDVGSAAVDPAVISFELTDGAGHAVVRVRRDEVDRGRAVLASLHEIGHHPIGVHVRGVSGTIRACEEKYIGRPPEPSAERSVVFEDAERRAVERNGLVDVCVEDGYAGATNLDLD